MKTVDVVTAFLVFEGRVALLKRSDKVGSYKDRYAAVSGYLEGDPREHFRIEIEEETGLTPYEYKLVRCGNPVVVSDHALATEWHVHPFLCEIVNPDSIRLNWENSEVVWVNPEEIRNLETVPGLVETFQAVSRFPLKMKVLPFIDVLKNDRQSGAHELAAKALEFFRGVLAETNAATAEVLIGDLAVACSRIGQARPSMAMIATTMELFIRDVQKLGGLALVDAVAAIGQLVDRHLSDMRSAIDRAVVLLGQMIPRGARVMIHSFSSSVAKALPVLKELDCSLIVTEARPGLEGRRTAALAVDLGLDVTLITDAAAGISMPGIDLCLMGIDGIELDGTVVNKAGSAMIAAAAYERGTKVYFLGESRKINLGERPVELEELDGAELWPDAPAGLRFRNVCFDRTHPKYITGILMETGLIESYQVRMMVHGQLGKM